jgi:hypothetical protein
MLKQAYDGDKIRHASATTQHGTVQHDCKEKTQPTHFLLLAVVAHA